MTSPGKNELRVIALGGLGEIGRNCTVLEWGEDIMVIDLGLGFPEEDMPGIDFVIPNTTYLQKNRHKIRGIVFTHGHYDHIGAIPYVIDRLGFPPLYAAPLTAGIIRKRQEDFPHLPKLELHVIKEKDVIKLGKNFEVHFFHVNHNIPDDFGLRIKTPVGWLVATSDFKFDDNPLFDKPADYAKLRKIGEEGVHLLLGDSTGAEEEGHSLSEKDIQNNLELIFKKSKGRIIAATFASLINRIQQLIILSEKYNRKVAITGYSMKTNVEIAKRLGYIKSKKGTIVPVNKINNLADKHITIICTGAQGEDKAVLMRIANKEHRYIKLKRGDTVIFSSSVIPGNERSVQYLKDNIYRQGAEVYHYKMMDIHAGGHGQRDDLRKMLELLKPKFFMPVHGHFSMLVMHGRLAEEMGVSPKRIVLAENGRVVSVTKSKITLTKETVPSNYVYVDGLGVGDVSEIVLRDRQVMAGDGMFVIIVLVDAKTGRIRTSPDIISRGFVYLKESKELLAQVRRRTKELVENITRTQHPINTTYIKDNLREFLGEFLFAKTKRRPMILPVVIEV